MTTLDQVKKIISEEKDTLAKKYHVLRIGVFGSVLRGEDTNKSDVDILVEFSKPISLFGLMDVEFYLEDKLGKSVDLVPKDSLRKHIGKYILKEVQYL
jgi:predicted nucleotidyltransferase